MHTAHLHFIHTVLYYFSLFFAISKVHEWESLKKLFVFVISLRSLFSKRAAHSGLNSYLSWVRNKGGVRALCNLRVLRGIGILIRCRWSIFIHHKPSTRAFDLPTRVWNSEVEWNGVACILDIAPIATLIGGRWNALEVFISFGQCYWLTWDWRQHD